jgi:hypothetical protein
MLMGVLLVSCAETRHPARSNSDTVYLQDGAAWRAARESVHASSPRSRAAAVTTPTPARATAAAAIGTTTPAKATSAALDDHLSARRTQLLKRVEGLSHDEADAVCLTMQLVPREQIFDHSVQPKKILVHYTSQATSEADLDFLERVLNDRR